MRKQILIGFILSSFFIIEGDSLSPIFKDAEKVKVCNYKKIKRNDIVFYDYKGHQRPIAKIVKGLPKDRLQLKKAKNGWYILINNRVLRNYYGKPYILNERAYQILSLYVADYGGIIPDSAYLLLGVPSRGSLDSTYFGLADEKDILGIIKKVKRR